MNFVFNDVLKDLIVRTDIFKTLSFGKSTIFIAEMLISKNNLRPTSMDIRISFFFFF